MIAGGKIAAIGPAGTPIPPEAQTIEMSGLDIWPGMVDAGSTIGLFEIGSLTETQDSSDAAQFQPELGRSTGLHPDSEHIPVTRANGILDLVRRTHRRHHLGPGMPDQPERLGAPRAGDRRFGRAGRPDSHLLSPAPEGRPGSGPAPSTRHRGGWRRRRGGRGGGERLEKIKELFRRAIAYDAVVTKARERGETPPAPDLRLEAWCRTPGAKSQCIFHADQQVEILDALDLARELKLKAVISGAAEAWKVADAIKQAKVPVLVGGHAQPAATRLRSLRRGLYEPGKAARRGGDGGDHHVRADQVAAKRRGRNLPYEAATAVAFGLPEEVALKAVTLTPAQILGVADQVGSLETGKRANLVVTAGHLLQPTTPVLALFIDGEPLRPESRHTQLYAKYRRRLDEVRAGRARLGIDDAPTKLSGAAAPQPAKTQAERQ